MASDRKLHIAMFPWLAFGHMLPYLNFAKLIASKGHFISFISTAKNINRLPPNLSSQITFVKFKLPPTPGLPEEAEATSDLPLEYVPFLKTSFDKLGPQLAQFLETSSPDWLIHDFSHHWAGPIASKLGIPTVFFSIILASTLAIIGPPRVILDEVPESERRNAVDDLTGKPKWVPPNTPMPPLFAAKRLMEHVSTNASGVKDYQRQGLCARSCDLVAVRGSYEMEPEWLKLLEDIYQKPVIPIGHLPPVIDKKLDEIPSDDPLITEFLDGKATGSVIYIAFGSEATVTREELTELALGLELSGLPFLWVLKKTQEAELPEGFSKRVRDRGMVYTEWAPQLKILGHESVGGFLTHNGWTSVVESICLQKPMILLPLHGEQLFTVNVLKEKKLGYAVPRDENDGSFTREAVAKAVKLVVVEEEGSVFRERVKEMSGMLGDHQRQNEYVDQFIECLRSEPKKELKEC